MDVSCLYRRVCQRYPDVRLHFYIDFNCFVDFYLSTIPSPGDFASFFNEIWRFVDLLGATIMSAEFLFLLCWRFGSTHEMYAQRSIGFDSTLISVGTPFMKELEKLLEEKWPDRLQAEHNVFFASNSSRSRTRIFRGYLDSPEISLHFQFWYGFDGCFRLIAKNKFGRQQGLQIFFLILNDFIFRFFAVIFSWSSVFSLNLMQKWSILPQLFHWSTATSFLFSLMFRFKYETSRNLFLSTSSLLQRRISILLKIRGSRSRIRRSFWTSWLRFGLQNTWLDLLQTNQWIFLLS